MKKFFFIIICFFILTSIFFYLRIRTFLHYQSPQTVTLYFKSGSSLRSISQQLAQHEVVYNAIFFEWMTRLSHQGKQLQSGEYEFEKGLRFEEILGKMVNGKVKLYPFTIPEGLNLQDIGQLMIQRGLTSEDRWAKLSADKGLIESLDIRAHSLEGYLFPDTFFINRETTDTELIKSMVNLFKKKITPEMIQRAQDMGLSVNEWVTLASLIEKETGIPDERPLIASVFHNRLKRNMLLQTDPSVIYGIKHFDGNLTKKDLERDSPYNTYTRPGLPPGPIASPGLDSLKAAIYPVQSDYLYFVAKGDGSHYFSKSIDEHNHAVQYYQLHRGNALLPSTTLPVDK